MDTQQLQTIVVENVIPVATGLVVKLGGALLFWVVGNRVIAMGAALV